MRRAVRALLVGGSAALLLSVAGCNILGSSEPFEVRVRIPDADTIGGVAQLQDGHGYYVEAATYTEGGSRLSQYLSFDSYDWSSTNNNVASIRASDETVRANGAGSCTIVATLNEKTLSGTIAVDVN